ncbi:MAG: ATP-binding cassette domain-containing protein [Chloroflexota bacterium]|nr:ATP-binding cassette domain-containing protein [Chloroflexota bacterium]
MRPKICDPLTAVDQISFDVRAGEVFALLGPNGAGKTTTIRMLTGLTHPTSGQARVLGLGLARDLPRIKKQIGHTHLADGPQLGGVGRINGVTLRARGSHLATTAGLENAISPSTGKLTLLRGLSKAFSTLFRPAERFGQAVAVFAEPAGGCAPKLKRTIPRFIS